MTDKICIAALPGIAIENKPQPLNVTFPDGSQLSFPVSGKTSFTGEVEESARIFFDAVIRHRDSKLEAERQRADEYRDCIRVLADQLSVNALPKEVIEAVAALKGEQVLVISKEKLCDWLEDNFDIDDSQRDAFAACFAHYCDCNVQSHSPAPVGEIVAWAGTDREKGITREVDFRFLRFDVSPGTKLYAVEPALAVKSDLLTRAEALAVETRALASRIQADE